ncbi:MAG: YhgE/Pip domain-containing protein [Eubacterium sp.]|nr:YhgE/Pip domain-containing protein [Eubacterium sp.]
MAKRLKKETKVHSFIKKHFMVIVVFAIMLIPSIYTVLFLGSMWDPYGNTGSLPVAIVNEDEAVIYGGKEINIGEQLCENLKKNDQLQFNFVDEKVALDGLENGTYYMVLVVPKNFSRNSTTLTEKNPEKMQLEYYVNPGTNYIASKFGESGVKSIKESINKSVINTYATTIYSKLNTIGDGFTQAADGSGQIYDGVGQLRTGNGKITDGLDTLSNGCLVIKKGTGTLKDGLEQYTDGVSQVNDGVKQLHDGVPLLEDGVEKLQDGASQLQNGTSQLVSNNSALNDGAQQLLSGLNTMSDQIGESLTEENLNDLQRLEDGLIELNDGIQTLQKAVNEDYKVSDETIEKIKTTISDVEALIKSDEFALMSKIISTNYIDWKRIDNLCDTLDTFPLNENNKKAVESLRNLSSSMKKVQEFATKVTPENAEKLVSMANKLIDAYYQLTDGVQKLSDGGNQALPVASETLKKLSGGLLSVQDGLNRTKAKEGETGLIEGMTTLKNGISQYTDGVSQVDSGVSQVSGGLVQLGNGLGTAGKGINKLYSGTQKLVKNNNKLNSGAGKLNDGTSQLYDGSVKLYNGTLQVDEGCEKLMFGANTLKESLADGAQQIEDINTGESAAEMLSQPVEANETFQRTINTNGEAMSAYMMCAGLWVACLAFCLMFSPFKTSLGSRKTFIAHAFIALFVSLVQAPIMVTLLMAINGMRPQNVGLTYLMAILASMAFMSIVYYLNTLLDSIGSFLLLILLCLQLSGAAGTYPIELSPKFYQIIHPFMPFSYGVDAFRSTLSTGNSLTTDILVFIGIIAAGIALTCLTYEMRRIKLKRKQENELIEA